MMPVVLLGRAFLKPRESERVKEGKQPRFQFFGHSRDDHRRVLIQRPLRRIVARLFAPGHRMPADIGEAVFVGKTLHPRRDGAFDAAAVDHDAVFRDRVGVRARKFHARGGVKRDQKKVERPDAVFVQSFVGDAVRKRAGQNRFVAVVRQHAAGRVFLDRPRKRRADQSQTDDPDVRKAARGGGRLLHCDLLSAAWKRIAVVRERSAPQSRLSVTSR